MEDKITMFMFRRERDQIYFLIYSLGIINFAILAISIGSYFSPWSYKNCMKSLECDDLNPCTDDVCKDFICQYTLIANATCSNNGMCNYDQFCDSSCDCVLNECSVDLDCQEFNANPCIESKCNSNMCSTDLIAGANCSSTTQCAVGFSCNQNCNCQEISIFQGCILDSDCGNFTANHCIEYECVLNACETSLIPGAMCSSTTQCGSGFSCNATCLCEENPSSILCSSDEDCQAFNANPCIESKCILNECQTNLTSGAECSSATQCDRGFFCNSTCLCEGVPSSVLCLTDSDCQSFNANPCIESKCILDTCETNLIAGATCSSTTQCSSGFSCNATCLCEEIPEPTGLAFNLPANLTTYINIDSIKVAPNSPQSNQRFGSSVAACGDIVFVGAYMTTTMDGAVYIYDATIVDFVLILTEVQILTGPADSNLGYDIAISENCTYLVAGAPRLDPGDRGGFLIYKKNESSSTTEYNLFQTVTAGTTSDLGVSVGISNNTDLTIMAGDAPADNVKVFDYNATLDQWVLVQTIVGNDTTGGNNFGISLDIIDNLAIVGAIKQNTRGAAYVFTRTGTTWTNIQKIISSDLLNNDDFGSCIAIYQSYVVVGAFSATRTAISSGGIYLFNNTGSSYTQIQSVYPSSLGNTADFGFSCSFNNNGMVIVGAPQYDSSLGTNVGVSIVYVMENNQLVESYRLIDYTIVANGQIGYSVFISDQYTIAGAPFYNNAGVASGVVLVRSIDVPVYIQTIASCYRYTPTVDTIRLWCQGNVTGDFNPAIYYVVIDGSALPFNSSTLLETWMTFSAYGRSNSGNSLISVLNPQVTNNNVFTAYILTYGSIELTIVSSSLRRISV